MSTDLSKTSSEVVETNSLREIFLFCAVLLFEIYSLAVSFGGPFFEVGYFLIVVISQTIAGAYIWAQLRQSDKTLPLPELLAMGFAIGSASAAISQLIIRDLLGIRLFISTLVPIIGVAIWLITKRDPQLPVKVTHATTNTLLWLLFPAPLALSFFVWELYATFVIPLFLLVFLIFRKFHKVDYLFLIILPVFLSSAFSILFHQHHRISVALSLTGLDEMFDEGHAIGFANWGIFSNIFQSDVGFSYYKLSYLWLGPILELTNSSPLIISSAIAIPVIFTFIGLALWALTFVIGKSTYAARVASVLVFSQHSLIEPWNIPLRPAQSLILCYLIGSLVALSKNWSSKLILSLITAYVLFVTFGTRAQYGLLLLIGITATHFISIIRIRFALLRILKFALPSATVLLLCYYLFFSAPFLDYGKSVDDTILATIASGLGLRIIVPMLLTGKLIFKQSNVLMNSLIIISLLLMFGIDHQMLGDSSFFTIIFICSVFISIKLTSLKLSLPKHQLFCFAAIGCVTGLSLRLIYDIYKWRDPSIYSGFRSFILTAAAQKDRAILFSLPAFILIAIILLVVLKVSGRAGLFSPLLLIIAISMSFGVTLAATFRQVTAHYRYQISFSEVSTDSTDQLSDFGEEYHEAVKWFRTNSSRDDVFAINTAIPDYLTISHRDLVPFSILTHRQSYIESPGLPLGLRPDYPRESAKQSQQTNEILSRLDASYFFPLQPKKELFIQLQKEHVKWFVVILRNTPLRSWEPWAATRFMNSEFAILDLADLETE